MRRLRLSLISIWLAPICLGGCGEAAREHNSAVRASGKAAAASSSAVSPPKDTSEAVRQPRFKGDEDDDETRANRTPSLNDTDADSDDDSKSRQNKSYHDNDDRVLTAWGHRASGSDLRAVAMLVRRYYAAAIADDAGLGCSLLFSLFAESLPEVYGGPAGPGYLRGETCTAVMSKLFKHDAGKFSLPAVVTALRVRENQGRALIGSDALPASYLTVRRERGAWKIDELESARLP